MQSNDQGWRGRNVAEHAKQIERYMALAGPILLIEDDIDDSDMVRDIIRDLQVSNELVCFDTTAPAFDYLKLNSANPFIIICDINLPGQNGLDFKRQIDADSELRKRSIPFIFYSTAVNEVILEQAYIHMAVQGFFKKPNDYQEMKDLIKLILDYWRVCKHPNCD